MSYYINFRDAEDKAREVGREERRHYFYDRVRAPNNWKAVLRVFEGDDLVAERAVFTTPVPQTPADVEKFQDAFLGTQKVLENELGVTL